MELRLLCVLLQSLVLAEHWHRMTIEPMFGFTTNGDNCELDRRRFTYPCIHGRLTDCFVSDSCPCWCDRGWTGRCCGDDINECVSNPCQNGGSCLDSIGEYMCMCNEGYKGKNCETNTTCHSNPCLNGGTCTKDHPSGHTCHCPLGFTGKNCEIDINECASNPCNNSAVCHEHINWFSCVCLSGFTGTRCETDIDDCQGNVCNNGTCRDGIATFNCTCEAGYTGSYCDTDINECASNPCQNSGICSDYINNYTCVCRPGFTGIFCETDINECESNPCQNKGRCNDQVAGYMCACVAGYTGTHCEINVECHSSPCLNGGICTDDQTSGHTCHCPLGFTGHNCEKEPLVLIKPNISLSEAKVVSAGYSMLTIPCYAEGIPVPAITWESLDKPSLPNNTLQLAHFLVFINVSTIDGGHYMCTAKNKVGTDIKVVEVIVRAKDDKLIAPVIHAPSSVQVKYYLEGRLTCNVTGFPTPTVTWKHNNKIVQSSGNTLVIHSVTNATTGSYSCIATNGAGTSQANIQLKVSYDVPKIITPPVTSVLMAGHSHNFTCIATGHPKPSIKWTYKMYIKHTTDMPSHQLYDNGSVLMLYSINTQESGRLTCTAQNEFGEDHVFVSVIVRTPNPVG